MDKMIISSKNNQRFCELTGDSNILHNKDQMEKLDKSPIIHGMLNLSYALCNLPENVLDSLDFLKINLGTPTFGDHSIIFDHSSEEGKSLETKIHGFKEDNKDIFKTTQYSSVFQNYSGMIPVIEGVPVYTKNISDTTKVFQEILGTDNEVLSNMLYAISHSSGAMEKYFKKNEKISDIFEFDVKEKSVFEQDNQKIKIVESTKLNTMKTPVYKSFQIYLPQGMHCFDSEKDLKYRLNTYVDVGQKTIMANVSCKQMGYEPIFAAQYTMGILPMNLVLRKIAVKEAIRN